MLEQAFPRIAMTCEATGADGRAQPFSVERAESPWSMSDRSWFRGHGRLVTAVLFALASSGWGGCGPRAEPVGERSARVRFVQTGHVSNLRRAEFSGDGRWLLTVSVDGEAILWDARAGRPRRVLMATGLLIRLHQFGIADGRGL